METRAQRRTEVQGKRKQLILGRYRCSLSTVGQGVGIAVVFTRKQQTLRFEITKTDRNFTFANDAPVYECETSRSSLVRKLHLRDPHSRAKFNHKSVILHHFPAKLRIAAEVRFPSATSISKAAKHNIIFLASKTHK